MIYITGDTHSILEIDKVEEFFEDKKSLTKNDYIIILGDVGVCGKHGEDVRKILRNLPVTTLWIDGNHEDFTELNKYKVEQWSGGNVHVIESDIIHLMRGQVFNIDGKKIFTFGGGSSADKNFREKGISWWEEEMPTKEEYKDGVENLKKYNYDVDYILTHTCPYDIVSKMKLKSKPNEKVLQKYFQEVANRVKFNMWYFGHYHVDRKVDSFQCIIDKIVKL